MLKLNPLKGGTSTSLSISSHTNLRSNNPEEVQMAGNPNSADRIPGSRGLLGIQNSKDETMSPKDKKTSKKKKVTQISFHTDERDR